MSEDNHAPRQIAHGHQNYGFQCPFTANSNAMMAKQAPPEIATTTTDEEATQMSQISGVALGPSISHLPDEYAHFLHPSTSYLSGCTANFGANSTLLSSGQPIHPINRAFGSYEGHHQYGQSNFTCSTPNTVINDSECFQKLLFPCQNQPIPGQQSQNRAPLGELSINNGLPIARPLNHSTFARSASSSSILTPNNSSSQTTYLSEQHAICGVPNGVVVQQQSLNRGVSYPPRAKQYIEAKKSLPNSAPDLTQNAPNNINMLSYFPQVNHKPVGIVPHLPPMVQRNPAVPVMKPKQPINQPSTSVQRPNPVNQSNQVLSIGLSAPQKPLTFNLKALTFITMQYLKKNTMSTNENILNYVINCLNGISPEKIVRKSKEGISLKRRIYDTINVMICLGLVKQSYVSHDAGKLRHTVYEWNGFDQFWDVRTARKEEVMLIKHKNKTLKAKFAKLQSAQKIIGVHRTQMITPMYLSTPLPKMCLRIPKKSVQMIESNGPDNSRNELKLNGTHQMEVMTDPVGILDMFYSYAYSTNDY